ncbi:hypothetical protein [Mycobacterium sp.]|uniref:hypothetical protein n=1 Tax=Mycobacterium sp. TaxID=1785 RepID=UPI003D6A4DAE
MGAGEDDIGPLRCQWKVILDQHLDLAEASIGKVGSQDRKTPLPRGLLGGCSPATSPIQHLLQQLLDQ